MGMFTRVLIPGTDKYTQIKCGNDQCDTYRIGDKVPYQFHADRPMSEDFEDGFYVGWDEWPDNEHHEHAVVIQDHTITAVIPVEGSIWEDLKLEERFEIRKTPPEAWSTEAWRGLVGANILDALYDHRHPPMTVAEYREKVLKPNDEQRAANATLEAQKPNDLFFAKLWPTNAEASDEEVQKLIAAQHATTKFTRYMMSRPSWARMLLPPWTADQPVPEESYQIKLPLPLLRVQVPHLAKLQLKEQLSKTFVVEGVRIDYWVTGIVSRNRPGNHGYSVDEVLIEDLTTLPQAL